MKFRGGVLGLKFTGKEPAVAETAQTTGNDAETANISEAKQPDQSSSPVDNEKDGVHTDDSSSEDSKPMQYGVQLAEATLKVWTPKELYFAYVL